VNSEVFDHTSVIRFLERRFGVHEPNISPWRRAVCGDLTSAFDFRTPNRAGSHQPLPDTRGPAARAAALPRRTIPATPAAAEAPIQATGTRPSRALPYALEVAEHTDPEGLKLDLLNAGTAGAVLHVYDRRRLDLAPRRYTLGAAARLSDAWGPGPYDLWILGPNGFHRHLVGDAALDRLHAALRLDPHARTATILVENRGDVTLRVRVHPEAYGERHLPWTLALRPGQRAAYAWSLAPTGGWYDLALRISGRTGYLRRFAGRLETGRDSISDPALGGPAVMRQYTV
jgi:phospholipase C